MTVPPRRTALAVCLALAAASPSRAGGLDPTERDVSAYVDAHRDEAVTLLEKVVNIPSATENLAGVREVGEAFGEEFRKVGFATRWDEMPGAMRRAGHLIAEQAGTSGKRLLLIGHLDTVLEGLPFRRDPEHQGRATGNGTVDMKGGDVVILYALKALRAAGALEGRRVSVILTGDEESAGFPTEVSRESMRALARRSDIALAFEAGDDNTGTIARRGVASWTLTVKARTGHSAGIFGPETGTGAIFEAARVVEGFRRDLSGREGLTFNPSLILGGTAVAREPGASKGSAEGKSNVIPAAAVVHGDLRYLTDAQCDAAEAAMRAVIASPLNKSSSVLEIEREYPAMAPTPGNYAVLSVLDSVSRDLGLGAVTAYDPIRRGAGDISFVASRVDGLDGLGTRGSRSHTREEWVDLDTLPDQVKRAALLIYRLTRDGPSRPAETPHKP